MIDRRSHSIPSWSVAPRPIFGGGLFFGVGLGIVGILFAGMLPALLPWSIVAGLCFGIIYLVVLLRWPAIGIVGYLCGILLSPDFKVSDVVTVLVLGVLTVRQYMKGMPFSFRWHPLKAPVFLLFFIALLSLALAVTIFKNQAPLIYRDGRVFVYWLWLPLLIWMVQGEQLTRASIKNTIISFAGIMATVALIQAATGVQFVAAGRVADLEGAVGLMGGITRVQFSGYVFISFALVWLTLKLTENIKRAWLLIPLLLVLATAIYVNFGRALWAWTAFSLILSNFLLGRDQALRLTYLMIIGGGIGLAAIYATKPVVLENIVDRITSVQREGGNRTSYGWRKWENEDAIARISTSPLVGVAIGGEYRPWVAELRLFEDHTRYVHNTYLFYALKLGVPGMLALLWLIFRVWWRAQSQRREQEEDVTDHFGTAVAAFLPAMIGLSLTQPDLAGPFGALFVSFLAAGLVWRQGPHQSIQRAE